eukprot:7976160-Alexandrium_andersonii.AAC.1
MDPELSWLPHQPATNENDFLRRRRLTYVDAPRRGPFEYAFYFRPVLRPIFEGELHPAVHELLPPVPWVEAVTAALRGEPWVHKCIALPAIPWAFQWIMVQGACAWHDDTACTAVLTPVSSWTSHEVLRVMRDLRDFGRPLHPRIVHVACNPAHYPNDLRSSIPPAAPDHFYHFFCYQH